MRDIDEFKAEFAEAMNFPRNRFHPMVWIHGEPIIGKNVCIGGMSEVYAKGARVEIGDGCDIASFVAINCADSHERCLGLSESIKKRDIVIEECVFVGSHSVIKGGAHIGHHSVVGAGTVVDACDVPPYSLIVGNPMTVKPGYYKSRISSSK